MADRANGCNIWFVRPFPADLVCFMEQMGAILDLRPIDFF